MLTNSRFIKGNIPAEKLQSVLEACAGKSCMADDPQHPSVLLSPAFAVGGVTAALVCYLHSGRLRTVELHLAAATAQAQRETLLQWMGVQDPCPDAMQSVRLRYPYGTVWVAADQRSGDAVLRITYAAKE